MNVIRALTWRQLLGSRRRFLVTLLGVMLSATMVTAVLVGMDSAFASLYQFYAATGGDYHWACYCSAETAPAALQEILACNQFSDVALRASGTAFLRDRDGQEVVVSQVNPAYLDIMQTELLEGELPRSSQQVLVTQTMEDCRIGDTLNLSGEQENSTVQVSGILRSSASQLKDENALPVVYYVSDQPLQAAQPWDNVEILGRARRLDAQFSQEMEALSDRLAQQGQINSWLDSTLVELGGGEGDSAFARIRTGVTALLLGVIAAGSALLIVNSFSISLAERRRTLGLLASVGATRAQKNAFVLYEALLVGVIGIPLGLAVGCAGLGITFSILNRTLLAGEAVRQLFGDEAFVLLLTVKPAVLAAAVGFSALILLLSAFMPARRAGRTSAMDAIRGGGEIQVHRARAGLFGRMFGPEGVLAGKNAKRSYRRYLATLLSLALSVVLLLGAAGLALNLEKSFLISHDTDQWTNKVTFNTRQEGEDILPLLDRLANPSTPVEKVLVSQEVVFQRLLLPQEWMSEQNRQLCAEFGNDSTVGWLEGESYSVQPHLWVVPDEEYEALAGAAPQPAQGRLDCVVVNDYVLENGAAKSYTEIPAQTTLSPGDQLDWQFDTAPVTLEIQTVIDSDRLTQVTGLSADSWPNPYQLRLVAARSAVEPLYTQAQAQNGNPSMRWYEIYYQTATPADLETELSQLDPGADDVFLYTRDLSLEAAQKKAPLTLVQVMLYGFVALIAGICAANIANTVSTGLALRRREFAMLQSVGMSPAQLRRMVRLESLVYAFRALCIGLPVGMGLVWLEWRLLRRSYAVAFQISWWAVLAAAAGALGLTLLASMPALRALGSRSLVEELRSELDR